MVEKANNRVTQDGGVYAFEENVYKNMKSNTMLTTISVTKEIKIKRK